MIFDWMTLKVNCFYDCLSLFIPFSDFFILRLFHSDFDCTFSFLQPNFSTSVYTIYILYHFQVVIQILQAVRLCADSLLMSLTFYQQ